MQNNIYTPDFFSQFGYTFFENILSKEECDYFTDILLNYKIKNELNFEGKTKTAPRSFYDNSYGRGAIPEMENAMRNVQKKVEEQIGSKIKHTNSFARIYYNGGTLHPHKDRTGLDYTMSITLRSNIENEWPLYWKDLKNNTINMDIKQGDGALILGTTMTHWRKPLICKENQYFAALFMHWSFTNEH